MTPLFALAVFAIFAGGAMTPADDATDTHPLPRPVAVSPFYVDPVAAQRIVPLDPAMFVDPIATQRLYPLNPAMFIDPTEPARPRTWWPEIVRPVVKNQE